MTDLSQISTVVMAMLTIFACACTAIGNNDCSEISSSQDAAWGSCPSVVDKLKKTFGATTTTGEKGIQHWDENTQDFTGLTYPDNFYGNMAPTPLPQTLTRLELSDFCAVKLGFR